MELPADVWLHIASFIPTKELLTLYGVNSTFFNIFMDARYKEVNLYRDGEDKMNKVFSITRLLIHAHRIRTLNLRPDKTSRYLLSQKKQAARSKHVVTGSKLLDRFWARGFLPKFVSWALSLPIPSDQEITFVEAVSDLFRAMSNLDKLNVEELLGLSGGPQAVRVRRRGSTMRELDYVTGTVLSTFRPTLRRLRLDIPYSYMPTLVFPFLEELDIAWFSDQQAAFINDHYSTLESLKLSFSEVHPCYSIDTCSSLLRIRHLPHLRTCHVRYSARCDVTKGPDISGIYKFLGTHSAGLQHLRLDLSFDPSSYSNALDSQRSRRLLFHVALPQLESLELLQGCSGNPGNTALFLQQYTHSLTSLKLEQQLSSDNVKVLLDAFSEHNKLRSLDFKVDLFSPWLIYVLATKLPSLNDLHIIFRYVCLTNLEVRGSWNSGPSHPEWKLRRFAVDFTAATAGSKTISCSELEASLRLTIPNLLTFSLGDVVDIYH